jgi:hypothetical protein
MKYLIICFAAMLSQYVYATDYVSATAGLWGTASTWSPSGVPTTADNVTISHSITTSTSGLAVTNCVIISGGSLTLSGNLTVSGTLGLMAGYIEMTSGTVLSLGTGKTAIGSLSINLGNLKGTGTFRRWFSDGSNYAINDNHTLFPMSDGTNYRWIWVAGYFGTGGTISMRYNDAATVTAVNFSADYATYVNRYNANWVISYSGLAAASNIYVQIMEAGMPGINDKNDLNITLASGAANGLRATPGTEGSSYILGRHSTMTLSDLNQTYYIASKSGSPLPVELTSYTAEIAEKSVELKWKTATETNNYGFEIQRSDVSPQQSGNIWSKIGFVEGNGTTNAPKSYSFIDKSANGKTSYRLKQIDRDGKFEYSQTVEVTAASTPKEFALEQNYPNPFNPTTAISYQLSAFSFTTLKIYDAIGREVATLVNEVKEAGSYSAQFDGTKLSSGLYFYKLTTNQFSSIRKMLLLK